MIYTDIEKSYVYFNARSKNCWRVGIKSILHDVSENTEYYLTKECRAEKIGLSPFDHKSNSEFCTIINNKKKRWSLRNIPIFKFNEYGEHYNRVSENKDKIEIYIFKSNYKLIHFEDVINKLKKRNLECLYTKIDYEYQNKKFFIFNKNEYLNFDGEKHNGPEYLQPIHGYVPFLKDGKMNISYSVKYLEKNRESDLEVKLRTNQKANQFLPPVVGPNKNKDLIIRQLIKYLFPNIMISEFCETIKIQRSKIEFYEKS